MQSPPIQRALISVSDKLGITDFARGLVASGVEIYSTGGTSRHLKSEGVEVRDVADYTGFPEMMDGRLKTLHPMVLGGILCRHDNESDTSSLAEHGIVTFELVVVNLYPFEQTVAREGVTEDEAIENIDIGGPTMVRAAAKNHQFTTVATSPDQYSSILEQVESSGTTSLQLRRSLARDAFVHTASYDKAIAEFFISRTEGEETFPAVASISLKRQSVLRYGENPHQQAALYVDAKPSGASVVTAMQLNGKELSYNNILDLDSALSIVRGLKLPAVSVIKHNNPCGTAIDETLSEAVKKAMAGDPQSAFGSVIGFNRKVDAASAEILAEPGLFIEAIVAPDFDAAAIEILTTKPKWKKNVRIMKVGDLDTDRNRWLVRPLEGGALMQEADILVDPQEEWRVVTEKQPTDQQRIDLEFAWEMVRHVKSNAITICKGGMLLGAGAGQMSRVDSVEIAITKAGERITGSVLGSDAFFPFPDSIQRASEAGVTAIIQPGGSRNDDDVIAACNQHGIAMICTGRRHFKH